MRAARVPDGAIPPQRVVPIFIPQRNGRTGGMLAGDVNYQVRDDAVRWDVYGCAC